MSTVGRGDAPLIGVKARPVWGGLDCWSRWRRPTTRRRQTLPQRSACETKRPSDERETWARRSRRPRALSPRNPSTQHRPAVQLTVVSWYQGLMAYAIGYFDVRTYRERKRGSTRISQNNVKAYTASSDYHYRFVLICWWGGACSHHPSFPVTLPCHSSLPLRPLPTASGFLLI